MAGWPLLGSGCRQPPNRPNLHCTAELLRLSTTRKAQHSLRRKRHDSSFATQHHSPAHTLRCVQAGLSFFCTPHPLTKHTHTHTHTRSLSLSLSLFGFPSSLPKKTPSLLLFGFKSSSGPIDFCQTHHPHPSSLFFPLPFILSSLRCGSALFASFFPRQYPLLWLLFTLTLASTPIPPPPPLNFLPPLPLPLISLPAILSEFFYRFLYCTLPPHPAVPFPPKKSNKYYQKKIRSSRVILVVKARREGFLFGTPTISTGEVTSFF